MVGVFSEKIQLAILFLLIFVAEILKARIFYVFLRQL